MHANKWFSCIDMNSIAVTRYTALAFKEQLNSRLQQLADLLFRAHLLNAK